MFYRSVGAEEEQTGQSREANEDVGTGIRVMNTRQKLRHALHIAFVS